MATTGNLPIRGFLAGGIKYVTLRGFEVNQSVAEAFTNPPTAASGGTASTFTNPSTPSSTTAASAFVDPPSPPSGGTASPW